MLNKRNGFTLIEALTGMSILGFIILITLPLQHLLLSEREVLQERRMISYYLHDELIKEVNRKQSGIRESFSTVINNKRVNVSFRIDDLYLKGCVNWINAKKVEETSCLYAIEKQ